MDTQLLQAFTVLAQELHFRRAAERLNIAQPTLTQHIKRLEKEINARLFERTKRTVKLTEAGKMLLDEAILLLARVEAVKEKVKLVSNGAKGHICLGVTEIALNSIFPSLIRRFCHNYPNVEFSFEQCDSASQEKLLLNHEIDIGILHPPLSDRELSIIDIYREPMILAIPSRHPLAKESVVSIQQLKQQPVIMISQRSGPTLHRQLSDFFIHNQTKLNHKQASRTSQTTIALVRAGFGLGIVPQCVSYSIAHKDVVFRTTNPSLPCLTTSIVYNSYQLTPAEKNLIEFVKEEFL